MRKDPSCCYRDPSCVPSTEHGEKPHTGTAERVSLPCVCGRGFIPQTYHCLFLLLPFCAKSETPHGIVEEPSPSFPPWKGSTRKAPLAATCSLRPPFSPALPHCRTRTAPPLARVMPVLCSSARLVPTLRVPRHSTGPFCSVCP